ncbi:hypothetical protein [Halomonas nitroreducens]|uniref:Uncharacterized protein n=1 Tax=Halomonas nitroreducens TaxID=447425 RepID=A0A431V244_9GAMM|nr:hypothetical protein [Halomonas nitroreducens]RTR02471.1 hypothetical protein EKG36_12820 [Halomonas nitroreducens]
MHRGLLLGGLLMVSSTAIAMDYSHPGSPSSTTDCVQYATYVTDGVEEFVSTEAPRDLSREDLDELMEKRDAEQSEEFYNEIRRMMVYDAYAWYKSTKYAYDPEMMYMEIRMECEMAIADKDYEEDMKDLERLMGD